MNTSSHQRLSFRMGIWSIAPWVRWLLLWVKIPCRLRWWICMVARWMAARSVDALHGRMHDMQSMHVAHTTFALISAQCMFISCRMQICGGRWIVSSCMRSSCMTMLHADAWMRAGLVVATLMACLPYRMLQLVPARMSWNTSRTIHKSSDKYHKKIEHLFDIC